MQYHRLLLVLVLATAFAAPASAATGTDPGSAVTADAGVDAVGGVDLALQSTNETDGNETDGGDSGNQTTETSDGSDGKDAPGWGDFFEWWQTQEEGTGENTTDGGGSGDSGGTDGSGEEDDGGILAGFAEEAIEGAILSLLDGMGEDASRVAESFGEKGVIFSVPAPGLAEDPVSWLGPNFDVGDHQDWWKKTWRYHWVVGFLGFAGILPALMFAMGSGNRKPDRGTAKRFVRGFLLIILGWIIIAFIYHSADAVTKIIAPDPGVTEEMLKAANDSNLEVLGPVLSGTKGTLLMTSMGVLYMQFILTFVSAALWPAMWVLNTYRSTMARSAGKIGLTFMGALLIMKIMQAMIFRFLTGLNITGGSTPDEIGLTVGIAVAFVLLPYTVLTKMIPRTLLIFGLHELREKGHEDRRYQQRMGNVRRKFNQSLRRSADGGLEQAGPANRGSKGLPNRQPRKLDSARSDGGRGLPRGQSAEGRDGDGPDRR